jgi:hypothetical protein
LARQRPRDRVVSVPLEDEANRIRLAGKMARNYSIADPRSFRDSGIGRSFSSLSREFARAARILDKVKLQVPCDISEWMAACPDRLRRLATSVSTQLTTWRDGQREMNWLTNISRTFYDELGGGCGGGAGIMAAGVEAGKGGWAARGAGAGAGVQGLSSPRWRRRG